MFKNNRKLLLALLLSLSMNVAFAQEKSEVKEEKRIKLIMIDKEGKKHVLDETYTGEMPEALKKKIAAFKAKMKAEGKSVDIDFTEIDGKNIKFKLDDASKQVDGKPKSITIKMTDKEGGVEVIREEFEGELPQEVIDELEKLKNNAESDGKTVRIDIDAKSEVNIEEISDGKVLIIKDGKTVVDEKFEGKMPEELRKKIEEAKGLGENVTIDIEAIESVEVFKPKDGEKMIIISTDDKELEGLPAEFSYIVTETEDLKALNGEVKVIIVSQVKIEDIKADDEDVPAVFREQEAPIFGEEMTGLNFYPNPSTGAFNLQFKLASEGNTAITIYDLNGKEVYSEQLEGFSGLYNQSIDLKGQEKGMYILKVAQNEKVLTKKLLIE